MRSEISLFSKSIASGHRLKARVPKCTLSCSAGWKGSSGLASVRQKAHRKRKENEEDIPVDLYVNRSTFLPL